MPNSRAPKSNPDTSQVEFRRAPRLLPFTVTGGVLGLLFALLLFLLIPAENRSSENILGLLLIALGSLGLGLGVLAAIVVDLLTARTARKVTAQRIAEGGDAK